MKLVHQLSKQTGIPIATIRFYEKSGLIKGFKNENVTSNNYTYYGEEVLEKLELINDAKSVGFTLAEIREIIDAWYSRQITKEEKLAILDKKLDQIETKIKELIDVKSRISDLKLEVEEYDC